MLSYAYIDSAQSNLYKSNIGGVFMLYEAIQGILIPFVGTSLGAACVLFMKNGLSRSVQRALTGFAAGVMVAASVWSLIIPAIEQMEESGAGRLSFLPAFIGFWLGTLFLLSLDHIIPHLHMYANKAEGRKSKLARTTMMVLAVTLHNIPEGMAVGIVYAGFLNGTIGISAGAALALSLGIAIQNFPEGAIISMPLHAEGESKMKALFYGILSGAVEPVATCQGLFNQNHLFFIRFFRNSLSIILVSLSCIVSVAFSLKWTTTS